MNTMLVLNVFKRIYSPHVNLPLGRWTFHNYKQTTLKIKYANEDHCGVCHDDKITKKIDKDNELDNDENYIYMMGYESVPK